MFTTDVEMFTRDVEIFCASEPACVRCDPHQIACLIIVENHQRDESEIVLLFQFTNLQTCRTKKEKEKERKKNLLRYLHCCIMVCQSSAITSLEKEKFSAHCLK
jgi:hypothetical protein